MLVSASSSDRALRLIIPVALALLCAAPPASAKVFYTQTDAIALAFPDADRIETDTDAKQAELRAALFEIEDSLKPVDAMFMYKVIELTGEIADMSERVGRRLELLLSH